ncbi:MAG: SpoIIE family protein phosphatase, partial [Acidobacteriota bacterium]
MTEHLGDIASGEPTTDREALHEHFDAINASRLRLICLVIGAGALAELVFALVESRFLHVAAPVITLALARHLFTARDRGLYSRIGSWMLILGALVLLAAPVAMRPGTDLALRIVSIVGPLVLSTFRLTRLEAALVFPITWIAGIAAPVTVALQNGETLLSPRLLIQTGTVALSWYVNQVSSRRDATDYLHRYRIAASRNRERLRMRRELDSARQMQLSMLPREAPRIEGLDIAAVSLPAAEVGGDYYEYFKASDRGTELAIGDVSGHGVASALLLSGLRSCLYLLQPEQLDPDDILTRLDGMVRDTTERRTFITLLYSVLDLDACRATVSAAGHPPPLHYRMAEDRVVEIECASPPLGTRLGSCYETTETDFSPGDILRVITQG